ncbi:DUF202 domain-containing protein [Nakamurella lactea]|uniref:DUF202 domain-containing protein n=1 Tax=Nakamurella lactea TaxID=459515 RepID=UPI0005681A45|nr:DUF202 domain-containing protein [Nakamurella lactea]
MPKIHDSGMQAERTRLSWARTSLALAVIGALELHIGRSDLAMVDRLPGLLMLLIAVGCWVYGGRRYLVVTRSLAAGRTVLNHRQGLVLAGLSLLPAAIAVWSILV